MNLVIESFGSYCGLEVFTINGISADEDEFIIKYDHDPDNAEDYGCGDMRGEQIPASDDVLEKYGITQEEYTWVANHVADEVSFGACGWCV